MKKIKYSLNENAFSNEDIRVASNVLKSKNITMSNQTLSFEKSFAKYVGAKYAVMVNSGSSANLLAVFASKNPYRKIRFNNNDEALIPSICWSTSLWPLVQSGLNVNFIDVDEKNLNINFKKLIESITKKTKLIMLVHVLGLSCEKLDEIAKICKKKKILYLLKIHVKA